MKQHLDTIPVWDAYKADCECPLCLIHRNNEASYVDNFLGGSVMEPATRIEVNKIGFCPRHFKMMYESGNRLGLALMSHTYLKETILRVSENARRIADAASDGAGKGWLSGKISKKAPSGAHDEADQNARGCILCDRLNNTMNRYVYTLIYMWQHESEFRRAFEASKGMCLQHYAETQRAAADQLSGEQLHTFSSVLSKIELENLERIEKELEWFTLKFDYRNQSKPWGNSQDAVERALNKLRGNTI